VRTSISSLTFSHFASLISEVKMKFVLSLALLMAALALVDSTCPDYVWEDYKVCAKAKQDEYNRRRNSLDTPQKRQVR
jgi:hypothetical protein